MTVQRLQFGASPNKAELREQLTRHAAEFGGVPETVEAMVRFADGCGMPSKLVVEPRGGLAYCIEGALRLACIARKEKIRVAALIAPGEFVPCPTSSSRSGYQVRLAPHDVASVATWSPAALRHVIMAMPDDGMPKFLAKTHLGWTALRERWAVLSTLDGENAVAWMLSDVAARFGIPDGDGLRLEVPLLDKHVAALAGMERERANRILNALMGGHQVRRLPGHRLWVSHEYLGDRSAVMRACSI